jgi:hypothetical protein
MKLKEITGLVRLIDPRYPTNLAILAMATAVGAVGFIGQLVSGNRFLEALGWSLTLGFLTISTWAIGREVDPDYELSAFVGVGLFLISLLFYDYYVVWPVLLVIIALRIVNRSNGLTATWLDSAALTIFAGWLAGGTGHWEYGAAAALAFLLDAFLPVPSRRQFLFAVVMVLIILFWQLTTVVDRAVGLPFPMAEWIVVVVTAILFISLLTLRSNHIRSLGDATRLPLIPQRVQAGQLLALVTGLLLLWQGADRLVALWSAMLGTSLYRIYIITRGKT